MSPGRSTLPERCPNQALCSFNLTAAEAGADGPWKPTEAHGSPQAQNREGPQGERQELSELRALIQGLL